MKRFLPVLAILLCSMTLTSCIFARIFGFGNGQYYEPDFNAEQEIPDIIPHEGGRYAYKVNFIKTKWEFTEYYRNFRFRLVIDNVQYMWHDVAKEALWDYESDSFMVEIPSNDNSSERTVVLQASIDNEYINDYDFSSGDIPDDHVPDWGEWTDIYSGIQEGFPSGD